ncbi:MAG: two-component regulator propeller domain-containing protein [Tahibacter sp.]
MQWIRAARFVLQLVAGVATGFYWVPDARALEPGTAFADYAIDNWNVDSGLPQLSILSIAQDHAGYLWIGTQNGIARFDGLRFEIYDRRSVKGVDTNDAAYSLVDAQDRIWFGSDRGVLLHEKGRFEAIRAPKGAVAVHGIVEMSDGTILFATQRGVMRYADHALESAGISEVPSQSLLRDGDTLWMGGVGEVSSWTGGRLTRLPLPIPAADARVTHLAVSKNTLWIGSTVGLFHYASGAITPVALDTLGTDRATSSRNRLNVQSLLVDRDGNIWLGTLDSLFRGRPDGVFERIRDEDFVRNSYVASLFEDREGNLWVGSHTESLFRLWNGWARRLSLRNGLTDPLIWSVSKYGGKIILGSNSNVVQLDEEGPHELIPARQLPNPAVYELNTDNRGRLWIGTRGGLAIYQDGQVSTPATFAPLARLQINAIVPQPDGDVWIGTSDGLFRFRNDVLTRLGEADNAAASRVRAIHVIDKDTVLIGTENGIRRVRADAIDTPNWARPLEGTFVTAIKPIRPGLLGITTRDAGLSLLSAERMLTLTTEHGLPSDNGWAIDIVDGQMYVPTIDGVWRVPVAQLPNPLTESARPIIAEMVLGRRSQRMHCCNGGGRSRSLVDGTGLWFPAIQGAVRIETKAIVKPTLAPTAIVEGLRHAGKWYPAGTPIALGSGPRDVELQFSGIYFRDPKNLHFRYRLEGYDPEWLEAGTRRSAFYTNLPPRSYRLLVQTSMGPSISSTHDGTMEFYFIPYWYERNSVRLLMALVLLALAALGQWRVRERYRLRGLKLEALIEQRTGELRHANELEHGANQALLQANEQLRSEIGERLRAESALQVRNGELLTLNQKLEGTQTQLLQSEKLASVGQLAAGVAHEINNPIGFVRSNLVSLKRYVMDIFGLLRAYETMEEHLPPEHPSRESLLAHRNAIELDYVREDTVSLLAESLEGITRVEKIVRELKEFSHLDDAQWQRVDLHRGIESTLAVASHELRYKAEIVKEFGTLPLVECLPFQINQVFLSLLVNAAHAISERGTITVRTGCDAEEVWVQIADDGIGIDPAILHRIFEPFFTTKPVGQGTGLGLSVSYGIIQRHHGRIDVASKLGKGTSFTIHLPIKARRHSEALPTEPASAA